LNPGTQPELGSVAAVVRRGDAIEAWHAASVAVVDGAGQLSHAFGDPTLSTLTRSSIKPFQCIALLTSGAADAYALSAEELAIACASHSGTDEHVRVVRGLLEKAGAKPSDLQCGAHLPIGFRLSGKTPTAGEAADPLRNACSGKHAGFLLLSRHLGAPLPEYLEPEGVVQRAVRAGLALACGVDGDRLPRGIDGCSAPNYGLSLEVLSRSMLRLAHPETAPPQLAAALTKIRDAMLAQPLMVSGERRFDYELMSAYPGNCVSKVGAEGLQLIAFREPALALAMKLHDGTERALPAICVSLLTELGLDAANRAELAGHVRPAIHNHRKLVTGEIIATLRLKRIS
jgi:L-asparaginase II